VYSENEGIDADTVLQLAFSIFLTLALGFAVLVVCLPAKKQSAVIQHLFAKKVSMCTCILETMRFHVHVIMLFNIEFNYGFYLNSGWILFADVLRYHILQVENAPTDNWISDKR
jgi:hypothetical protein